MTKSRFKENYESTVGSTKTEQKAKPIVYYMPYWNNEEMCFKNAILRDVVTKKIVENGWPRPHNTSKWTYENWLSQVINQETENFFQERNQDGIPIPNTTARYVVNIITRVRDAKGSEYLLSKGFLKGFDAGGTEKTYPNTHPEKWRKTVFAYTRFYNEKTGANTTQTRGPSKVEDVYELPFSQDNVSKLYERVEDNDCEFIVKDIRADKAVDVPSREDRRDPSSVKERLEMFMNKPFDYLFKTQQLPAPVIMEHRMEAVAQGIIKGVASTLLNAIVTIIINIRICRSGIENC